MVGLINTQRDRTDIMLYMDGASGSGPIGRDVDSDAISGMRILFWNALREDNGRKAITVRLWPRPNCKGGEPKNTKNVVPS
jgi:hypothetical protein